MIKGLSTTIMNRRGSKLLDLIKGNWRIILVVSAIIIVLVVKYTTSFQTFMFVLGALLIVVPITLLLTSGICSDIKFFIKRFEHLPEDNRPTVPGYGIGMSRSGPATMVAAEMIDVHQKAMKLTGTEKEMYFHKMQSSMAGIDYDSMKLRRQIRGDLTEPIADSSLDGKSFEEFFIEKSKKIEKIINEIEGENIKKYSYQNSIAYQFNLSTESEFFFLLAVVIEFFTEGTIKVEAIFNKFQPFSLAFIKFETEDGKRTELNVPELAKIYSIDYSHPKILEKILEEEKIIEALYSIHAVTDSFKIDRKYFLAETNNEKKILDLLNTLKIFNKRLISEEAGLIEVEQIKCYECNTPLEISDKKCPKCGEKRPECGVCLLDLYPSEAKEIVRTACCGIYAHKNHLIMWLDKTDRCPNCRTRKPNWTKFLE